MNSNKTSDTKFPEFWPNSDLKSSNGSVPRRSNLSTQVPSGDLSSGLDGATAQAALLAAPRRPRGAERRGDRRAGARRGRVQGSELSWKVRSARDRTIRTFQIRVRSTFLQKLIQEFSPENSKNSGNFNFANIFENVEKSWIFFEFSCKIYLILTNSDLNSSNGSIPRRSNLSTQARTIAPKQGAERRPRHPLPNSSRLTRSTCVHVCVQNGWHEGHVKKEDE